MESNLSWNLVGPIQSCLLIVGLNLCPLNKMVESVPTKRWLNLCSLLKTELYHVHSHSGQLSNMNILSVIKSFLHSQLFHYGTISVLCRLDNSNNFNSFQDLLERR